MGGGVLQHFKPLDVQTGQSNLRPVCNPTRKQNDDYPAGKERCSELVSPCYIVSSLSQQHPACVSRVVGWSPAVPQCSAQGLASTRRSRVSASSAWTPTALKQCVGKNF